MILKKNKKEQHSKYWLDMADDEFDSIDVASRGVSSSDVFRLAAIKQAISNFVRIVTNRPIPVYFSSGQQSYTNNEAVVISASTKEKEFDSIVGLSLHEASHCRLTNFDFLRVFDSNYPRMIPTQLTTLAMDRMSHHVNDVKDMLSRLMNILEDRRIDYFIYRTSSGYRPYYEAMYNHYFNHPQIDVALQRGLYRLPTVGSYMFYLINMTNENFDTRHLTDLDKIMGIVDLDNIDRLDHDEFRWAVEWNGNPHVNYDMDKGPEIFRMACEIAYIIYDNVDPSVKDQPNKNAVPPQFKEDDELENNMDNSPPSSGKGKKGQKGKESGKSGSSASDSDEDSDDADGDTDETKDGENDSAGSKGEKDSDKNGKNKGKGESQGEGADDDSDDDADGNADSTDKTQGDSGSSGHGSNKAVEVRASGKQLKRKMNIDQLRKAIDKQKSFVDGNVKKKKLSKKMAGEVEAAEKSGAQLKQIKYNSYGNTYKTTVLMLREMTQELMMSDIFPYSYSSGGSAYSYRLRSRRGYYSYGQSSVKNTTAKLVENNEMNEHVAKGFRLGRQLAQRLSVRNQTQTTRFNRQDRGHLDKRRLSGLGYELESVFYRTHTTEFKPVYLHLSIDASGSMGGRKFGRSITTAVALAVAADTIDNLEVEISLRSGEHDYAVIAIIYDSRKDNLTKIRKYFKYLRTGGSTPEGLCFEAYMDYMLEAHADQRYFVNISDGMPAYHGYSNEAAYLHTAHQINVLRQSGFKIMSYFVGSDSYGYGYGANEAFRKMYGADASFIKFDEITGLVTTLNKLFLTR